MSLRMLHLLAVAVLLAGSANLQAAYNISLGNPSPTSGIDIDAEIPFDQLPPTGFCPIHVRIKNDTNQAHTWTLEFTHSDSLFGYQNPVTNVWRTELSVPAGRTGEWDLFVPLGGMQSARSGYMNVGGRISGYGINSERFGLPSRYTGGVGTGFILISDKLADAVWSKLEPEIKVAKERAGSILLGERFAMSSRIGGGRGLEGSKVELQKLPPDWRALSGVSGLWLAAAEWPSLSSDRLRTIRQWVATGGHLFIASPEATDIKLPLLPELSATGTPVPLGMGSIRAVQLKNKELPVSETAASILSLDNNVFPAWTGDHRQWAVVDELGWPAMNVKLIILFVSLFAVVIGPVNLRVLAPPNRRARLFFTVPILSLAASVVLFGVIAFGDGFGGTGFRNALVYLPAGENIATISQEQVSRSRLLLSRTFTASNEMQVSLVPLRSENKGRLSLERTGGQAGGDWFRSRSVQAQLLRAIVPARAEVVVQNPQAAAGDKPVLLSSVGGRLRDLLYVDSAGKVWQAEELPTGTPVTLKSASHGAWNSWMKRNEAQLSPHLREAVLSVQKRPGHFYAIAESIPEAPLGTLAGIRWTDKIVCFGTCLKGDAK